MTTEIKPEATPSEPPKSESPKSEKDRVVIFDTTLRDGEQCPGATMTHEEKIEVAELLDQMGVDVIEAGFPIASEGDFAAVHEIAKRTKKRGRMRALPRRFQGHRPLRRGDQAGGAQAHPYLPVHLAGAHEIQAPEGAAGSLRDGDRAGVAGAQLHRRRRVVERGRHPHRIRFSLPLRRRRAIKAGATTINIPDTVGYTVPEEYFSLFQRRARARAEFRSGALLGALPRRSRHGGGEFARRRARRRAADRMHHQRHRRARRQCLARRSRDGDEGAQRRAAVLDRRSIRPC